MNMRSPLAGTIGFPGATATNPKNMKVRTRHTAKTKRTCEGCCERAQNLLAQNSQEVEARQDPTTNEIHELWLTNISSETYIYFILTAVGPVFLEAYEDVAALEFLFSVLQESNKAAKIKLTIRPTVHSTVILSSW